MSLGERLKIARQKRGLKQTEVRDRTNINNKTLSGYENNVSDPDTSTLTTLAELYEVSYKWLLTGEGSMSDNNSNQSEGLKGWLRHETPDLSENERKELEKDITEYLNLRANRILNDRNKTD